MMEGTWTVGGGRRGRTRGTGCGTLARGTGRRRGSDMSEPQETKVRKNHRRRGWLKRLMWAVSGSLLALLALISVPWAYRHINDARELRQYLAELDRSDPGWRLDDVLDARREVPDEENSALAIADAFGRLPEDRAPNLDGLLDPPLPPQMQLDEGRMAALDEELAGLDPVIEAARRMRTMKHGRHPLSLTADPDEMDLRSRRAAGRLAELTCLLAARAAQRGDMRSAVLECEIALRAQRSIGDDPLHRTQWWRMMWIGRALFMLERVLAQGEPPPDGLVSLQDLLREEEKEPLAM